MATNPEQRHDALSAGIAAMVDQGLSAGRLYAFRGQVLLFAAARLALLRTHSPVTGDILPMKGCMLRAGLSSRLGFAAVDVDGRDERLGDGWFPDRGAGGRGGHPTPVDDIEGLLVCHKRSLEA